MYVRVCTCVRAHSFVCLYVVCGYVCIYLCVCTRMLYVCVYVCAYMCVCVVYPCMCVYVHMCCVSVCIHMWICVCMYMYDIYNKTFKGDNFHGFHRFSLTANVLPLKMFLLHNQSTKIPGRGQTTKLFSLECCIVYGMF